MKPIAVWLILMLRVVLSAKIQKALCLISNATVENSVANMSRNDELKESLGEELCAYCPWQRGEIDCMQDSLCEGIYCDDALEEFLDDNEEYFDSDE
nr:MAG: hypothetical protein [Bacteriophage sp.]